MSLLDDILAGEGALERLAAEFGRTAAGQIVLDLGSAIGDLAKRVQSLEQPAVVPVETPAAPAEPPTVA